MNLGLADVRSGYQNSLDQPFAHGGPAGRARLKSGIDDFIVEECLGFECAGEGEHLFLRIEKRGLNTEEAAIRLARFAGVSRRDVGFAGLKDKNAVARQWFSIRLPKITDGEWNLDSDSRLKVLMKRRHLRKLKRGALAANRFSIRLREVETYPARLEALLAQVRESGVPNYFGPQRFGRNGSNLDEARRFFKGGNSVRGRQKRAMLLSVARSFLFNRILGCRVEQGTWNCAIDGDALMFDASKAYFKTSLPSDDDVSRVNAGALHPSGTLWGRGESGVALEAMRLECGVLQHYPLFCDGLEKCGVESGRRALRLFAREMIWRFEGNRELKIEFVLPPGGYATSVLRELLDCTE